MAVNKEGIDIPVWEKACLTLEEASAYSNIGIHTLEKLTDDPMCPFVLWKGNRRRLIKRKEFLNYISKAHQI